MQDFDNTVERALVAGMDDLGAFLRMAYTWFLEDEGKKPESPIEHALLIGMMTIAIGVGTFETRSYPEDSEHGRRQRVKHRRAIVKCQEQLGRYRVDFLIDVLFKGENAGTIVVECDGHEFHERTKEQAARDRSRDRELTLAGHKVFRFTGSEIYRQPVGCAFEIHEAVMNICDAAESGASEK